MSSNNNNNNGSMNQMLPHKFNKLQKQTSSQNVSNLMIQEKDPMNSTLDSSSTSQMLIDDDKTAMNLLLNIKEGLNFPVKSPAMSQFPPSMGGFPAALLPTHSSLLERNASVKSEKSSNNKRKLEQLETTLPVMPNALSPGSIYNPALMVSIPPYLSSAGSVAAGSVGSGGGGGGGGASMNPLINTGTIGTSNTTNKTKSEIYILQYYEPRFYQIYEKYYQYYTEITPHNNHNNNIPLINLDDHLLSLCLEHMISFCCWARKSNTITNWIKTTLDDNNDLRPEVRNGLSMILMYCFAAAQAKTRKDSDMFITLQDTETGLGIVNKTSLKIYNDPYQYFNFIKSCITGLIDAGKIPENERINTPKKVKPQNESKEEIDSFYEMKKILNEKLNHHEIDATRQKIMQISTLWYRRVNIRTRRFASALAILNSNVDFGNLDLLPPDVDVSQLLTNIQQQQQLQQQQQQGGNNTQPSSTSPSASVSSSYTPAPSVAAPPLKSLKKSQSGLMAASLKKSSSEKHLLDTDNRQSIGRSLDDREGMLSDNNSVNTLQSSSNNNNHQPHSNHKDQRERSTSDLLASHISPTASAAQSRTTTATSHHFITSHMTSPSLYLPPSSTASLTLLNTFIPTVRFDRISMKRWEITELRVYDIENFLSNHPSYSFYLIDEACLTHEERENKQFDATSSQRGSGLGGGVVTTSLHQEFGSSGRKGIVTSWLPRDHQHMKDFLQRWLALTSSVTMSPPPTLLQSWQLQQGSVNQNTIMTSRGVIGYESMMQIGFVIRKNEEIGLYEDCWRMMYFTDLLTSTTNNNTSTTSFLDLLITFFPQLMSLLPQQDNNNNNDDDEVDNKMRKSQKKPRNIVLKYYAHHCSFPVYEPPMMEKLPSYQTIGLISDPTDVIFARLNSEFVFHDIILQAL